MVELTSLKKRYDFLACAKANRVRSQGFYLQAQPRGDDDARIHFGLTCSRKVGDAVVRNRAKRRLRQAACSVLPECGRAGWNYVLIGLAEATVIRDWDALLEDLRKAIKRIHDMPIEEEEVVAVAKPYKKPAPRTYKRTGEHTGEWTEPAPEGDYKPKPRGDSRGDSSAEIHGRDSGRDWDETKYKQTAEQPITQSVDSTEKPAEKPVEKSMDTQTYQPTGSLPDSRARSITRGWTDSRTSGGWTDNRTYKTDYDDEPQEERKSEERGVTFGWRT